jgi:hypothetical protein
MMQQFFAYQHFHHSGSVYGWQANTAHSIGS